jgi:hypothetical protein
LVPNHSCWLKPCLCTILTPMYSRKLYLDTNIHKNAEGEDWTASVQCKTRQAVSDKLLRWGAQIIHCSWHLREFSRNTNLKSTQTIENNLFLYPKMTSILHFNWPT